MRKKKEKQDLEQINEIMTLLDPSSVSAYPCSFGGGVAKRNTFIRYFIS